MKFLKSKFFLICVAVALSVALITGCLAMLGFAGPVKLVLGTVAKPFRLMGTWAANAVNGITEVFDDYEDVKAENDALRAELEEKNDESYNAELLAEENKWLKEYLNIATKHPELQLVDAKIIALEGDNFSTSVTLNKGSVHGISNGMAVMTEKGIVGKVVETGLDWCRVVSILDTQSSVGAHIERTGASGIIEGAVGLVEGGNCKMTYIESGADIRVGDRVCTTGGAGSSFPAGLYIGEVKAIDADPEAGRIVATVETAVDFSELSDIFGVMVVIGYKGGA